MADDPLPAHGRAFVPAGFTPPTPPRTTDFWLEPLGPQHNDADYAAWTSSMEHIHATPGFESREWPHPMSLTENLADLEMHADHFERAVGFTYTVRSTGLSDSGPSNSGDDVIGCVYIYPSADATKDADVRSWVRQSHAHLDATLWSAVSSWLTDLWPFDRVDYAPR